MPAPSKRATVADATRAATRAAVQAAQLDAVAESGIASVYMVSDPAPGYKGPFDAHLA